MYLYETHCHTAESSDCGQLPAEQVVALYRAAGYDGLVITDHFNVWNVLERPAALGKTWAEQVRLAFLGYRNARAAAQGRITVLPACELRFRENENDYLVFGMPEDYLAAHPDIFDWGIERFSRAARGKGFLLAQAHPFRDHMQVVNPALLDMLEVFNGHPRHNSRNGIAQAWADLHGLPGIAGSDCHFEAAAGRGGVLLPKKAENMSDFVRLLRKDHGLMIR